jgi:hypothetical protein
MNRVNRAAARFTLRTGSAGSKGVVAGLSLPCGSAVILPALSDFAKGALRRISLSFRSQPLTFKRTKTVCACAE